MTSRRGGIGVVLSHEPIHDLESALEIAREWMDLALPLAPIDGWRQDPGDEPRPASELADMATGPDDVEPLYVDTPESGIVRISCPSDKGWSWGLFAGDPPEDMWFNVRVGWQRSFGTITDGNFSRQLTERGHFDRLMQYYGHLQQDPRTEELTLGVGSELHDVLSADGERRPSLAWRNLWRRTGLDIASVGLPDWVEWRATPRHVEVTLGSDPEAIPLGEVVGVRDLLFRAGFMPWASYQVSRVGVVETMRSMTRHVGLAVMFGVADGSYVFPTYPWQEGRAALVGEIRRAVERTEERVRAPSLIDLEAVTFTLLDDAGPVEAWVDVPLPTESGGVGPTVRVRLTAVDQSLPEQPERRWVVRKELVGIVHDVR